MSLSGYWGAAVARAMEGADKTTRLALALGPIRSIIRLVDDSPEPMTVNWAQSFSAGGFTFATSRTNVTKRQVEINPLPVIDSIVSKTPRSISTATALDVTTAFALHESGHARHSRDASKILLKVDIVKHGALGDYFTPRFEPLRLAGWVLNLLRDVRDEALVAAEWPGFAPYFPVALDWVWENDIRANIETAVGSLAERCNMALATVRFSDKAEVFVKTGQLAEDDRMFWLDWRDNYQAGRLNELDAIDLALKWLTNTPKARLAAEKMIEDERIDRERGERMERQLARLLVEGIHGAWNVCLAESQPGDGLNDTERATIEALLRDELTVVLVPIVHGDSPPSILMRKPHIGGYKVRTPPPRLAERLRSVLVFRSEEPAAAIKLQRDGQFDDTEVHRWAEGDYRLFTRHEIEAEPDAVMGLLMDLSGSMESPMPGARGMKYEVAIDLATAFVTAAHEIEGVEPRVWGHSTNYWNAANVYRFWEPSDPVDRISMAAGVEHAGNFDGYAIAACVQQLVASDHAQKVLFVLSDGIPAGNWTYGGEPAMKHVRAVVDWAAGQGVSVIQIAIDTKLRPEEQEAMFGPGNWVGFTSYDQLPRDLGRLMERFLR